MGDLHWEKTSPEAIMEGKYGDRNCSTVNCDWGVGAGVVLTIGIDC